MDVIGQVVRATMESVAELEARGEESESARTACVAVAAARLAGAEGPTPFALSGPRAAELDRLANRIPVNATSEEDAVTRFYEEFLARSAPAERKGRGVYFTPPPIARFIVRSVDWILRESLGFAHGLAGMPDGTRILDPAAGTGVFLHAAVAFALAAYGRERAEGLARDLAGIEVDPAALAACAANVGRILHRPTAGRLAQQPAFILGNALGEPGSGPEALDRIRFGDPVGVVLGNPPYLGRSANRGRWIRDLLEGREGDGASNYLRCDGVPLDERNPKWLNDDYVKFLRFAHWRIERTGWGVVGFVVNHNFLDGSTFRGMRESLFRAFDTIHVLDLHGNANRRERGPDGGRDENVFPIRQGVAIALLTRRPAGGRPRDATVYHADLWGRQAPHPGEGPGKLAWIDGHHAGTMSWTRVRPTPPFYLFPPRRTLACAEYAAGFTLKDIFPVRSLGVTTGRDRLAIRFAADDMAATARTLLDRDVEDARALLAVGEDGRDWSLRNARDDLRAHSEQAAIPVPILYRPFDIRWTLFTGRSRGFLCRPRRRVMEHLLDGTVPALLFGRAVETPGGWSHVIGTRGLAQLHAVSMKEVNQVAPLYLRDRRSGARTANLAPAWVEAIAEGTGLPWSEDGHGEARTDSFGAEEVMGYLYAILHAPSYRSRHAEDLRRDYPRLPVPRDAKRFLALAKWGLRLFLAHVDPAKAQPVGRYEGPETARVGKVSFAARTIRFAPDGSFEDVPEAIWQTRIGDYQVCRRWLADREGRILAPAERTHFRHVMGALSMTLEFGRAIDRILV